MPNFKFRVQRPIARKTPTGTSLKAKGLTSIPKPQLDTEDGSSTGVVIQEIVPALVSPFARAQAYNTMMNDAAVDVSVRAWKTPVLGSELFIDPYSSSDLDLEIADFIWDNLNGGMSQPLVNAMEDILRMCEDGYSIVEKVYEQREWTPKTVSSGTGIGAQFRNTKNYIMLKKLAPRPVLNVQEIIYDDNGGPKTVVYNAIRSGGNVQEVKLDISRVVIFTLNRRGGNVTGKSVLRTAYPHWYYKTHMYKIDAIQKERHGIGVPRGKLMPGFTTADKTVMRNMLRNLRTNEEAFILQTPNVEIDFAELSGNPVDVMGSAEHHNTMIMLNVMAQFMTLGTGISGSSGSRSTGGVQADTYLKALRFVANYICDMVNMYIIPELVVWNFPTKSFPQLKVRNIGETRDLQMLASGLANLLAQGGITMDTPTEQWVRKVFDMPAKQGETPVAPTAPPPPTNGGGNPANVPVPSQRGTVQPQNPTKGQGNVGKPPTAP